jgi:hypothetical protein
VSISQPRILHFILWAQRLTGPLQRVIRAHGWVAGLYVLIAIAVMWPMFSAGNPPGVDAPTFLHLGWVLEKGLTGDWGVIFNDPFWYGGYPYIEAYSPLSYGLLGVSAAVTPIPVEILYRIWLLLAYASLGMTVYWLALEFRLGRALAFWTGLVALASYPMFAGLGVFGWYSTMVALPLGLAAYAMLERAMRLGSSRSALAGGALFGACVLAHHMTGFGLALGFIAWGLYQVGGRTVPLRTLAGLTLWFSAGVVAVSGLWVIFFLKHIIEVGFEREQAGNWIFGLDDFRLSLFDRGLIRIETYPSYLGWMQIPAALGAVLYALVTRARISGAVAFLLMLTWFSLGIGGNPLIRMYPFSGLDVARFPLFMAPFMALLAGYLLYAVRNELAALQGHFRLPGWTDSGVTAVLALGFLVVPVMDVMAARDRLAPLVMDDRLEEVFTWLKEETPEDATILAMGFRNWDAYWIPAFTDRAIMDGWNDEGANNWQAVREVRHMGWFARVDTLRLAEIMEERDTDYLVIYQWNFLENPGNFERVVQQDPFLFRELVSWPGITIFERIS